MSEWKKVRIGDLCSIRRGASPRPIHAFIQPSEKGGMPWVKIADATITDSRFVASTKESIIEEGVQHSLVVHPSDLILSNSATPGLPRFMKITACIHDGWLLLRDFHEVAKDFLFYQLYAIRPKLLNRANGSVFNNLKTEIVRDYEISLPPLPTQRKIAAVLGALDDKIENNRKICANLEAQAQAIFKSWFVDFEPFGGKMPQGWKEVPLSSIATYLNGLAMQKYRPSDDEDSLPVLKIKELRQGFCDSASERCSASIDPRYVIHDGDVIFSWSGSLLVDFWCGGTAGLNQHLFKVYSDKYDKWFVYSWTNHYLASFIKIAADKATTMGHITRDHLDDAKVCIPFDSDIEQVGRVMKPLYDEIITKRIETRALAAMREALLPKLMSGEIDVEKVEVQEVVK